MNGRRLDEAWRLHDELQAALARGPGNVFTPRGVAVRLAGLTLGPLGTPPCVLDPACGAGALLLGALEWAARERPEWIAPLLHEGLHGWDLRPEAADACNRVLRLLAGDAREFAAVQDALARTPDVTPDAILANPPWVSYSGRHAASISAARRAGLARRFAAFRGWPSLHTAFAQRCAELAGAGRLGLLLPLQVAELAGYGAARHALTARHELECVLDLDEAFPGVTEPVGLFVLKPSAGPGAADPFPAGPAAPASAHRPLPPGCFGDIGVHTGNAARLLVAHEPEPGALPVRVGRDITPYCLAAPGQFIRRLELPAGSYARVPDAARFEAVQVVLRQTADRPVAARNAAPFAFRNSVLACFGAPGHDPDFLVAVFNSDTAAALHRAQFRDARQRTFPQVKLSHLRALPVPGPEIGPLYERIANAARAAATDEHARMLVHELVRQAYAYSPRKASASK
jgi:hypothetical protein